MQSKELAVGPMRLEDYLGVLPAAVSLSEIIHLHKGRTEVELLFLELDSG